MANPIDIFITEPAFKQVERLISLLENGDKAFIKMSQSALEAGKNLGQVKTPNDLSNFNKSNKEIILGLQKQSFETNKLAEAQKKATEQKLKNDEKQRLSEIKLQQDREKAFDKHSKAIEKEAIALEKAENTYNKVQSKVNGMIPIYNNLQTKVALGIRLSAKEESQLQLLTNRITKYQDVLKATDATIGKHQREVGNYAKANSNLSYSFGQITRELPNFGQSFSVGVLSLTNNIGALQDSIKQVKAQNAELKLQGKDTVSLVSQIGSAFFSWNTALYLGIGLLSAYSKEISEYTSELFGASKAMKSLKLSQDEFGKLSVTGAKDSQLEIIELKKYLAVVSDKKISDIERNIALKQLRQQYPFYFKNLTDEQILLGQTTKAQEQLNIALNKRKQVEKATEFNVKNKQNLIDIEQEIKLQEIAFKNASKTKVNLTTGIKEPGDRILVANEERKLNNLLDDRIKYKTAITNNDSLIIKLKKETIALEYKNDKTPKSNKKPKKDKQENVKLNFDYIKSEGELARAILERKRAEVGETANNESLMFETRIKARQEYSRLSIELADLEYQNALDLSNKKQEDDIAKNELAKRNGTITEAEYNQNKIDLHRDYLANAGKSEVDHSNKLHSLMNEDLAYFKAIEDKKKGFAEQSRVYVLESEKAKLKLVIDNEKLTTETRQEAFRQNVILLRKELDLKQIRELANSTSEEQTKSILDNYKNLNDQLDLMAEKESPVYKKTEQLKKQAEDFANSFSKSFLGNAGMGSLNIFTQLDIDGKTTFENLLTNAEGFRAKMAVVMGAVGDIMKDLYAFTRQSSQENFDQEKAQLEEQYNISTAFAGDSAEAKKEIDKQYQAKQKEIKQREAKANKDMALFNIGINTAQGVISALASTPPNVPLSIMIGVIGLAQAAAVSSKEIPKYFKGGKHGGGIGMINDAGGSNYIETVKTPDGKISQYSGRNVVLDMPKGTEIFTPEQWHDYSMKQILQSNGIVMPKYENNNTNNNGFNDYQISRLIGAIENTPVADLQFDNGQFQKFVKNGHQTKISLNNRVNFKGQNV